MASMWTRVFTWMRGEKVGEDAFGNVYYQERRKVDSLRRRRRWVVYRGRAEASKVPAEWHAWLHYTTEAPVPRTSYGWAKPHQQNMTGTEAAYYPPGHDRHGWKRDKASGDYEPWQPE